MIELMGEKIADFVISQKAAEKEERDIIIYGSILFIDDVVNTITVLLIGILFHHCLISLVFYASFALMREQTGGYHAKTHLPIWDVIWYLESILYLS